MTVSLLPGEFSPFGDAMIKLVLRIQFSFIVQHDTLKCFLALDHARILCQPLIQRPYMDRGLQTRV